MISEIDKAEMGRQSKFELWIFFLSKFNLLMYQRSYFWIQYIIPIIHFEDELHQ